MLQQIRPPSDDEYPDPIVWLDEFGQPRPYDPELDIVEPG